VLFQEKELTVVRPSLDTPSCSGRRSVSCS